MKRWAVAAVVFAIAGCGGPNAATPARDATRVSRPETGPDKRGVVTLYDDTYADPVPAAIAAEPDGNLWFTDSSNGIVESITTKGVFGARLHSQHGVSTGITTGPDGNLWFTASGAIGRLTTTGSFTFFTDTGGAAPQGITVGPDRALWFTESNGTIGRITLKGKVSHFTVAPSNARLEGIVTGPDGNLWATEFVVNSTRFSNYVIRLSPKGKYASFRLSRGNSVAGPAFICVGSDKALWVAEQNRAALGRLTVDGKYTEFPTGEKYSQPYGIATGRDGALWFTDFSGLYGIGRMTTSGKTVFYKVAGSDPETVEIASGPDGAMWFTASLSPSAIGRITTR